MSLAILNNHKSAINLLHILQSSGKQARFIGGCVRDAYLHKECSDIDIATTLLPNETLAIMHSYNIHTLKTGIDFGTITAIFDKQAFEITTLRRDIYCNGRHAKVIFTDSWSEDAARRDFTINAMSYSLSNQIHDYFNGIDDLTHGIIRFVGDPHNRIVEDYLRILRLFRFFAYYGKKPLASSILLACKELAKGINILSGERIQTEMYKILQAPTFDNVLLLMHNTNILSYLINYFNIDFNYLKFLLRIEYKFNISINPIRRLAALLCQESNQTVKELVIRWKLSSKDKRHLCYLTKPQIYITGEETTKDLYKILRLADKNYVYDLVILQWAKILQKNNYINEQKLQDTLNIINNWHPISPPITGQDLINIGIPPGNELGKLLKEAINFWEENDYRPTKNEIIHYITSKI
ncbi:CCA-adding enzyme [Rickettsiales bacterium Ac37b]|nr:CCA-adding enzyme [Rickettsiales bacterium Ac37b]